MGVCKDCKHIDLFNMRCPFENWPVKLNDTCVKFDRIIDTNDDSLIKPFISLSHLTCENEMNIKLRDHQQDLVSNFYKKNLVAWPKNHGKTFVGSVLSVFNALSSGCKKSLVVAPDTRQLASIFQYIKVMYNNSSYLVSIIKDVKAPIYEIIFSNGSIVRGVTDPKGQDPDLIIVDEANHIPIKFILDTMTIQSNRVSCSVIYLFTLSNKGMIEDIYHAAITGDSRYKDYKVFKK